MLNPRIIPVLLVRNKGLVKTIKFKNEKYLGDPLNAVKIFNEKKVDELIILDIDASVFGLEPDYKMIEKLALECRMPLCYGGGIKTIVQGEKILGLGVEKISLSSIVFEKPEIISELSRRVGKQSVVVVLDVKKNFFPNKYECFTHNGKKNQKVCPIEYSVKISNMGAGEIVINSIDNDGMMTGYDLDLIHQVKSVVTVPVTALGGAGNYSDIKNLIKKEGIVGAAAGSMFVFKGKYKAVLINYPTNIEKKTFFSVF
jgi:cyclase